MIATSDFARGRPITVNPVPREITYFVLAKEFHWTPDKIDKMKPKRVKAMLAMLNVYNKVQNQEMKKITNKRS